MVDGIELVLGEQPHQVRELERGHTIRLQQDGESGDEVVDVRHMREHVVGGREVGGESLRHQFPRQLDAEEALDDLDAFLACRARGAGRRFDAGAGDAALHHILQQVAVVGRDLDHVACGTETETFDHRLDITPRMRQPTAREAAEIGVLGVEQLVGLGEILGLRQPALFAYQHA